MIEQKPLELILARNLLSCLATPAFLLDPSGAMVFYNEAAGSLVGRRFEEIGMMAPEHWTDEFGPFGEDGQPLPSHKIAHTRALSEGHPAHGRFRIRSAGGTYHRVQASAIPIVGSEGPSGAIVIFWPVSAGEGAEEK
jgi:PAS domain-containing protein